MRYIQYFFTTLAASTFVLAIVSLVVANPADVTNPEDLNSYVFIGQLFIWSIASGVLSLSIDKTIEALDEH